MSGDLKIFRVLRSPKHHIEKAACVYVLGFGAQMEVIELLELHDRVVEAAKKTISIYTNVEPLEYRWGHDRMIVLGYNHK